MAGKLIYENVGMDDLTGWSNGNGERMDSRNLEHIDGGVRLWTRKIANRKTGVMEWKGCSLVFETQRTYGRFQVELAVDKGVYTKALALLWCPTTWPPEIDFMEIGGTDAWDRQRYTFNTHYGTRWAHKIIHRTITADMTQRHTVSLGWREDVLTARLDGNIMPNVWGKGLTSKIDSPYGPGVDLPMKLHLTYWPHHNDQSDPWPEYESKMDVFAVRVYD